MKQREILNKHAHKQVLFVQLQHNQVLQKFLVLKWKDPEKSFKLAWAYKLGILPFMAQVLIFKCIFKLRNTSTTCSLTVQALSLLHFRRKSLTQWSTSLPYSGKMADFIFWTKLFSWRQCHCLVVYQSCLVDCQCSDSSPESIIVFFPFRLANVCQHPEQLPHPVHPISFLVMYSVSYAHYLHPDSPIIVYIGKGRGM